PSTPSKATQPSNTRAAIRTSPWTAKKTADRPNRMLATVQALTRANRNRRASVGSPGNNGIDTGPALDAVAAAPAGAGLTGTTDAVEWLNPSSVSPEPSGVGIVATRSPRRRTASTRRAKEPPRRRP